MAVDSIPPGWYADPANLAGLVRWWDGRQWTWHTHPVPRQPQPPAPPAAAAAVAPRRSVWTAPPPTHSTRRTVVIAVISTVVAVLVLLILTAIALPVFLNNRAKAEAARTTITLPPSTAGLVQLDDAATRSITSRLLALPLPGMRQAAVYGTAAGQQRAAVLVGRAPASPADQLSFIRGFKDSTARTGATSFRSVNPGPLGGQFTCGAVASRRLTVCGFIDPGAYGTVTILETTSGDATATTLRAAIEQRR